LNAVSYFLKKLLGEQEFAHVKQIDIKMHAVMYDHGECFITRLKDNTIKVRIKVQKGISFMEMLLTLAHECVHAAQFIDGRLRFTKRNGDWVWKNRNYGLNPYAGLSKIDIYKKLPWEKEAITMEGGLVREYVDHYIETN
jgi:hypothetical protein